MPLVVAKKYVEQRDGGFWIIGSRISLDSVVYAFKAGLSPESIVQSFPLLTLEQVYGAIAFYFANRNEIDAYIAQEEVEFDAMPQPLATDSPSLYQKLMDAKDAEPNGYGAGFHSSSGASAAFSASSAPLRFKFLISNYTSPSLYSNPI